MTDFADSIRIPGDVSIPGLDDSPAPARNKGGRPRGSKTDPAKAAARRAREREIYHARKAEKATQEAAPAPLAKIVNPAAGAAPSTMAKESAALTSQLAAVYELTGSMVMAASVFAGERFYAVGEALQTNAQQCAASVVVYSEGNPRVRALLMNAKGSAGLIGIAMAHAPILMAAVARAPKEGAPMSPMAEAMKMASDPSLDLGAMMRNMFATPAEGPADDAVA